MAAIEDALWENGGELTEELALALQETELSLARKADGYNALLRSFAATKENLKAEIDRLTKLKKTAENAEKRIKQHICDTMGAFGIDKIEGDKSKISRVRTTAIETNDDMLMFSYQKNLDDLNAILPPYIRAEMKVSKTAIKEYQKEQGILPAGAEVVENYSLRIR
jgi:chromosome segregation ATPase